MTRGWRFTSSAFLFCCPGSHRRTKWRRNLRKGKSGHRYNFLSIPDAARAAYTLGGFIHLLLLLAIIVILGVIQRRKPIPQPAGCTQLPRFRKRTQFANIPDEFSVAFSRGAVGILSERLRTCPWPTALRTDGGLQFPPLCS